MQCCRFSEWMDRWMRYFTCYVHKRHIKEELDYNKLNGAEAELALFLEVFRDDRFE